MSAEMTTCKANKHFLFQKRERKTLPILNFPKRIKNSVKVKQEKGLDLLKDE